MVKELWIKIRDATLTENAVFVLALGLCPALAVTTSARDGFAMGATLSCILIASSLVLSLMSTLIPCKMRVIFFVIIIGGFASIADMVLRAYFSDIARNLGLYIPLLAVNCVVFGQAELFATKNKPKRTLIDALRTGAGFTIALILIGGIREILGYGTLLGLPFVSLIPNFKPATIMLRPPGAFIIFGIFLALFSWIMKKPQESQFAEVKGIDATKIISSYEFDD